MKNIVSTRSLFVLTIIIASFIFVNNTILDIDLRVPLTVIILLSAALITIILDKKVSIPIEKPNNDKAISVFWTVLVFIAFLIISLPVSQIFSQAETTGVNFNDSLKNFASSIIFFSQVSPLIVSASFLFLLIIFGFLIPVAETTLGVSVYEYLLDTFNIRNYQASIGLFVIITLISAGFAIFHFAAKGFGKTADPNLATTFLFMATSLALVYFTGQYLEAILLHIMANSTAITATKFSLIEGTFLASPLFLILIFGAGLYFLLKTQTAVKLLRSM